MLLGAGTDARNILDDHLIRSSMNLTKGAGEQNCIKSVRLTFWALIQTSLFPNSMT